MRSKKGFTLIELIIVVAIIGALIIIMSVNMDGYAQEAGRVQCDAQRSLIVRQYQAEVIIQPETKLINLIGNKDNQYFSTVPKCSKNGYYVAGIDSKNPKVYCSKHDKMYNFPVFGEEMRENMKTLNEWVRGLSKEDQIRFGFDRRKDNDTLREFLLNQIYDGSWASITVQSLADLNITSEGPYYVMPYLNDPDNLDDPVILYASDKTKSSWYTNLIFNHENGRWYSPKNRIKGISITMGWDKIKKQILSDEWETVQFNMN